MHRFLLLYERRRGSDVQRSNSPFQTYIVLCFIEQPFLLLIIVE